MDVKHQVWAEPGRGMLTGPKKLARKLQEPRAEIGPERSGRAFWRRGHYREALEDREAVAGTRQDVGEERYF